ncbi:CRISPR-associated helicase Cas3' [Streptomyces sp. DSM 44915]|uniref:CRISPR-associated helicase Cas3 n=1 Tax=Streptomyces chisholmiae TaxID=3075540 RepID=A0ABU2JRQ3_9ACTN|nr:CRISPR-associated helicase Cas3' [Streptomyces sp. DSM 44915]MDT0267650.1 CRISPR-associated helicase Cas3' [Streptomyces sp. DSM 44915]
MTDERLTVSTCATLDPRLWGKERGLDRPYPVVCHLLDTGAVYRGLWDDVLGGATRARIAAALGLTLGEARDVTAFWAAMHDLGKISPPFQAQVPAAFARLRGEPAYQFSSGADRQRDFRHEMATHWALVNLLAELGYPMDYGRRRRQSVAHQVAQLLGGHHGRFSGVLSKTELLKAGEVQPALGEHGWHDQRRVHLHEVRRILGADAVPTSGLPAESAVVVAGLVVVADWLASQTSSVRKLLPPVDWTGSPGQLDAHFNRSSNLAKEAVRNSRLGRARFDDRSFGAIFPYAPNPLQRDIVETLPGLVAERGPGLVLVTAPTGDGKTEAALFAASVLGRAADARGLYFALPTMATADGMFPRVRKYAKAALSGERALTLLHSMAWLSPVYADAPDEPHGGLDLVPELDEVSAPPGTVVEADGWLRGPKRPILASLGVGTIDQALTAMLPVNHNALRLFGLSEKVFVVDEAHAYGPWMQQHLVRLLEWLGAMKAPVVLLSATLTGQAAGALVDAYRRGAGFEDQLEFEPRYPGWLFADVRTGQVTAPRATGTLRQRTLEVDLRMVSWDVDQGPEPPTNQRGRRAALREVLSPVAAQGGTALVCCTTVAEAQQTYRDLCRAFPGLAERDGGIRLLHSRFPARERQRISEECEAAYGKPQSREVVAGQAPVEPGVRPPSILVATQVVEQSLDLDFDLVVSDLAPLAQLLQRAGRGCRNTRGRSGRPAWLSDEERPRLVVLAPAASTDAKGLPGSMAAVYDPSLLVRTVTLLGGLPSGEIAIPNDVQHLIDEVYAEDFAHGLHEAARRELKGMDLDRKAREMVERSTAATVGVVAPAGVNGDLSRLSERDIGVTEDLLTTRLGADTGRVLCLYEQSPGHFTLDRDGKVPLLRDWESKPSRASVRQLMQFVTPVPGKWARDAEGLRDRPESWEKQPLLRQLVLLPMAPEGDEGTWHCRTGGDALASSSVGLERSR